MPFVVGANRSGTTLLRLMLDAHPELAIPPETHFVPNLIELFSEGEPSRDRALAVITSRPEFADFGLAEDTLAEATAAADNSARGVLLAFYGLYAAGQGKSRCGDKTPGYSTSMRDIEGVLPEARFVHIIRDGRDVALSVMSRGLRERTVEELAKRWKRRIKRTRKQGAKVAHYTEVRYEDLITDTEPALRRVCEFLDLPFDPAMLSYHERAAERMGEMSGELEAAEGRQGLPAGHRSEMHAATSEPPQRERVEKWKREMNAEDAWAFKEIAGELLAELGYEVNSAP
ncbi:MAG: hypothetical protein QOI31_990 [Solirubrobacterales bacterium]|jgi:hypothetical protein|nr:hypothetical protein [Solirubrobacterales bacterium]